MKNIKIITLMVLLAALIPSFVAAAEQVTVDFGTKRWTVSDDLYAAHVGSFGGAGSRIDATPDGKEDILSDYQAHRKAMDDAKISYIRRDMDLNNMVNKDFTFNHYKNNPANIDIVKSQVAWAAASNKKILLETTFMPDWLATKNSQCATHSSTCEPKDYAQWGKLLTTYLDEVGCDDHPGTCEIEVWNEPYLPQFFLSDGTCQQRIDAYVRLYTNTRNAIKAKYPDMQVGGPSGFIGYSCSKDLLTNFMQKVPESQVDFITIHTYADATLSQQITDSMNLIRANGHGKNVKITEFGAASSSIELGPQEKHEFVIASAFVTAAGYEPTLTTLTQFQWSDDNKYSDGKPYYAHWPWRREMFSEAALDNTKHAGFYVSKLLGTIHSEGSNVVKVTSSTPDLLTLATTGSNGQYLTLVNRNWAAKTSISLTIMGASAIQVKDIDSGTVYAVKNGVVNIGDVPATSVRSFQIMGTVTTTPTTTPTPTPPVTVPTPVPTPTPTPVPAPEAVGMTPAYTVSQTGFNLVQFEAEHGEVTGDLSVRTVSGASAIIVPNTVSGKGEAEYLIDVPKTGSYVLWARTIAPTYNDDSFYARIDNGVEALWDIPLSPGWTWNKVTQRGEAGAQHYLLTAGTHKITVRSRENGAAIEEWALSSDEAYLPVAR